MPLPMTNCGHCRLQTWKRHLYPLSPNLPTSWNFYLMVNAYPCQSHAWIYQNLATPRCLVSALSIWKAMLIVRSPLLHGITRNALATMPYVFARLMKATKNGTGRTGNGCATIRTASPFHSPRYSPANPSPR